MWPRALINVPVFLNHFIWWIRISFKLPYKWNWINIVGMATVISFTQGFNISSHIFLFVHFVKKTIPYKKITLESYTLLLSSWSHPIIHREWMRTVHLDTSSNSNKYLTFRYRVTVLNNERFYRKSYTTILHNESIWHLLIYRDTSYF